MRKIHFVKSEQQAIKQTCGRDLTYNVNFKERSMQLLNDKPKQCCLHFGMGKISQGVYTQ